jgi:hypothetical protein
MNVHAAFGGEIAGSRRVPVLFVVTATLALGVLAGFLRAVLVAPLHVPLDPNEGWNAYHAVAAIIRGNPYPPADSFMINNYPPLSFYIVGLLGSGVGDNVMAGRTVSLVAFVLVCVFIVIALRRMYVSPITAAFAVFFFASTLLLTSDYVGMNDPQLLGHALQLGALLLLLRRRSDFSLIASAAVFVAGGFVKHNLFALPLASLPWLALTDRRSAILLAAGLLGFSFAGIIVVQAALGVNLFHELHSARNFSLDQLESNVRDWLPLAVFPLCSFVWLVSQSGKDRVVWLSILYAGISITSGIILLGGAGVDVNAMFDADISLALCVGLALSRFVSPAVSSTRTTAQVFSVFCILPFAAIAWRTPDWRDSSFWLSPMREDKVLAKQDVDFLRDHDGPAMCEDLTFCYWADKEPSVDVFNLNQQFETGVRYPTPLLKLIDSHYFHSVELDETSPFPFPKRVELEFERNYRLDHQDDEGLFFVPR